jgi:hypothetical protein
MFASVVSTREKKVPTSHEQALAEDVGSLWMFCYYFSRVSAF